MPERKGLSDEQWAELTTLLNQASKAVLEMTLAYEHLPLEQMASLVEERIRLAQGCFGQIWEISNQAELSEQIGILQRAALVKACFECSARSIEQQIKARRYWVRRGIAAGQNPEAN